MEDSSVNTPMGKYKRLMQDLLWGRAIRPIPMEEEEQFTEEMDSSWDAMSMQERAEVEQWFASLKNLSGGETFHFIDVDVQRNATILPRRAA